MRAKAHAALKGEFRISVRGPDGSEKSSTGFFPNLITDAGLDRIGSMYGQGAFDDVVMGSVIHLGSGTATPSPSDTALQSQSAQYDRLQRLYEFGSSSFGYVMREYQAYFEPGEFVGEISELGISRGDGPLWCRSLALDPFTYEPDTVQVCPMDYLTISYRLYMLIPTQDFTGTVVITADGEPQTHSYVMRALRTEWGDGYGWGIEQDGAALAKTPQLFTGDLVPVEEWIPEGRYWGFYEGTEIFYESDPYVPGSRTLNTRARIELPYEQGAPQEWWLTGFDTFTLGHTLGYWQIKLSPEIELESETTPFMRSLALGLSISWSRM